ncbi:hypothetical protein [Streptomyces sp. NPDC059928]|uniref:hypothetical protein n=1 Tax=unclassified Streptomyces TaxID=2593676 RepID=UPI00365677FF
MGTTPRHPALDQELSWPTLRMWVRREDEHVDLVSLAPARGAHPEEVLLPCDSELLIQLGKISLGSTRARLYAVRLTDDGVDHRLVLCQRGSDGAVRVSGAVSSIAEPLYGKTRAAMLASGQEQRAAGNQEEAVQWSAMARQLLMAKRARRRGHSLRTVSGGLPTLGKH